MTTRITLSAPKINGTSNIPLRRTLSRNSSNGSTSPKIISNPESPVLKWKNKFEESEEKRKILLSDREKALRSLEDLEKKHLNLQVKHDYLETELFEKNEEYAKLSIASKNLYKEYETLKNRYETETGAIAEALKDTYKQNKELKRRTLFLDKDTVDEGVDAGESSTDSDIENLNKTIKKLSNEVAELQTELDSVRQSEFQTFEQNIKLSEDLEQEKDKNEKLEQKLEEIKKENDQLLRVTEMMRKELENLKNNEEEHRNYAVQLKKEADTAKKERNVLAHRSTILMQGFNDNNGNDCMVLLEEIEKLKTSMEEQRIKYEEEINILQERIDEEETSSQMEVLEERLKIVESELQEALKRADTAEQKLKAPPAPPPPPPPPMGPQPPVVPLRRRKSKSSVQELAESIGIQPDSSPEKGKAGAPGVNEDIINAIKEGKFTLRKAKKDKQGKENETPKAVSEILNILGSLKRAPKKRQSQFFTDGD